MDEKKILKGIKNLSKLYHINYDDLISTISKKVNENYVPLEIFLIKDLNPLEAIVKYLKENKSLKFSNISKLLDRDQRVIWVTYNNVKNKPKISVKSKILIPTEIFQDGNLSILESVVKYLKESYNLSLSEIARALERDPRNIWKVYNNSIKKLNEKK